jgi:hypothetical protein
MDELEECKKVLADFEEALENEKLQDTKDETMIKLLHYEIDSCKKKIEELENV